MLLAFGLLLLAIGSSACPMRRTTIADVDKLLRSQLPVGSPHARVSAVLDSLEVEHSGYEKQEMVAIWRRTSVRLFDESAIQARFYFDVQGSLLRYELEEQITGM
jgi:hypothetical protein